MKKGIVKEYDPTRGFGFIQGDDGEDYFLHISKVRKGQKIRINCRVKFDYIEGQMGPEAENVTLF